MKATAEVRWFQSGTIPPGVQSWFEGGESPPVRQVPRVDRYLRLASGEGLGLKLREGLFEVKQRSGRPSLVRFHANAAGWVERWRKWSFLLAGGYQSPAGLGVQQPSWIPVSKDRYLRVYDVGPGKQLCLVPLGTWPVQGCALELSALCAGERAWWTLGFEAFGPEAEFESYLRLVVAHVFGNGEAPRLEAGDSFGYPEWLARMTVSKAPAL